MKNPLNPTKMQNHSTSRISSRFAVPTLFLYLALSGCMGVYEGGFECPPGEGVGCKSISDVNGMINQDLLPFSKGSKEIPDVETEEESQNNPCGKDSTCPLKPDSWYWVAPGALIRV